MTEKMVLSTSLLVAYENIAFEPRKYQKTYKRLLKLLSLPYKTNKRQLVEAKNLGLNNTVYERLLPQLHRREDRDVSLEALAANTMFKVILTEDKNAELPYVYYDSSFMANQLTMSLSASQSRDSLIKYLQTLCATATKVTLCDNYLAQNWHNTQSLFNRVLPRHSLDIEFVETPEELNAIKNSTKITSEFAQSIFAEWRVTQSSRYANSHDRYLLIESPQGTVEVMLSSGFDHIWKSNPKEITCVFRERG